MFQGTSVKCEQCYTPQRFGTVPATWAETDARLLSFPDVSLLPGRRCGLLECVAAPGGRPAVAMAAHTVPGLPIGCGLAADCRRALVPWMPARVPVHSRMGTAILGRDQHRESPDVCGVHRGPYRDTFAPLGIVDVVPFAAFWSAARSVWFCFPSNRTAYHL